VNETVQKLIELTEILLDTINVDIYPLTQKNAAKELDALRLRLSTVGCWIPCDEQNPPPTEIPDDTSMIVYVQAHPDYPRGGAYQESGVRVVVDTWVGMGKLGHDITHWIDVHNRRTGGCECGDRRGGVGCVGSDGGTTTPGDGMT
jgi:hypothetical protein